MLLRHWLETLRSFRTNRRDDRHGESRRPRFHSPRGYSCRYREYLQHRHLTPRRDVSRRLPSRTRQDPVV